MSELHVLRDLIIVFGAALVVVTLLTRLRLPTIAGFLVAGALIGPSGLGWIRESAEIERLAEIGVVLLLFTIGLEFSLRELRRLGRVLVVGGSIQLLLTIGAVAAVASVSGVPVARGFFYGFLVALSSTAIVLKGLAERGETDAPHGRLIVGVLLFQDLCVVPMMLVIPALTRQGQGAAALGQALLTAAVLVAGAFALARIVVPRALHVVAMTRARDLFILAVVLICVGIAWLTSLAGLSLALGAFLAGIVLADSEYGHQAFADVVPLREIFTSLFFVSMGMLLDVRVIRQEPLLVFAAVAVVLVGKTLLATLAGLAARFPLRVALVAGLALSQVGEFSFVLAGLGRRAGLLDESMMRLFLAASIVTMLVTPFVLRFGPHVAAGAARLRALDRLLGRSRDELARIPDAISGHVVVLGYGIGGEMMAKVLREAHVPFVVLDINAERVREVRRRGEPIYFGDVTNPDILTRARVAAARQVVLMLNDPGATLRAVRAVRQLAPEVTIVARARYVADVPLLLEAGATEAVAQEFEASLEVIHRVMGKARHATARRGPANGADRLSPALVAKLPAGLAVESLPVREETWICGRSLAEAQLRARSGATVVALSRRDGTAVHPAPQDVVSPGDVVCLVGHAEQISAARDLLQRGPRGDVVPQPRKR